MFYLSVFNCDRQGGLIVGSGRVLTVVWFSTLYTRHCRRTSTSRRRLSTAFFHPYNRHV